MTVAENVEIMTNSPTICSLKIKTRSRSGSQRTQAERKREMRHGAGAESREHVPLRDTSYRLKMTRRLIIEEHYNPVCYGSRK